MKLKPERPVRGFLKRNGFYIAVAAFVIAGAALSYGAITAMMDIETEVPPETKPPVAQSAPSSAEPDEPEPIDPQPDDKPEQGDKPVAVVVAEEPLMPVHIRPLAGSLVKPFSGDELVKSETLGDWRTHNGADYAASEGDAVAAIYSGEVVRAGADDLLGNIIELELDSGYTVLYGNLGPITGLRAGDRVSQGDELGTVGRSSIIESAEEPHLHLELMSGSKRLDPETLFN